MAQMDNDNAKKDVESNQEALPEWKPTRHELFIILTLALVSIMVSLDATIVVTSLGAIITDLNGTAAQGFWIGTSYLLTSASTMPFTAAISEIFGRPICLLFSLFAFTIGSILCCSATSVAVLIVGRCIQGIGGGGIQILALVIMTDFVPLRYRPKWFGVILAAWALGNCLGPIFGGAIAEHTTWRWVFYLMFPICATGFVAIPLVLTLAPKTRTLREKLIRVDWIGGTLFISSCTIFLIAISWGGTQEPWRSFRTLLPLILGVTGLVVTLLWEIYGAKEPFLRHSLFYCPSSFAIYFGTMIQGLLLYGQLYYGPLYFLSVKLHSPLHAGVDLLPVLLCLVPSAAGVGTVVTRFNSYRWAIWSGWAIVTLTCGLMILWDANTSTVGWVFNIIFLGFGHGFLLNAQNFASQAICQPGDEAAAAAMYAFLRSFGTAIGVGLGGSIFQNGMENKLAHFGLDTAIARNAERYIYTLHTLSASVYKSEVLDSYTSGLHGVYGFFCGVAGAAGLISLIVKHFDMNRHLESEHTIQENRLTKLLHLPTLRDSRVVSLQESRAVTPPPPDLGSESKKAMEKDGSDEAKSGNGIITEPERVVEKRGDEQRYTQGLGEPYVP